MKTGFLILVLLAFAYGCWAALTELQLINLSRSTHELNREEPVTWNGPEGEVTFKNRTIMKIYLAEGERSARFPWAKRMSEFEALVLLAAGCGYAGGLIRLFIDEKRGAPVIQATPWIGLGLAIIILAIAETADHFMLEGDLHFKPGAVVAGCLLTGIAWENAWKFLQTLAAKTRS